MKRLRLFFALVVATAFALSAHAARQKPTRPPSPTDGSYKGYIVLDAATGNVLAEENADIANPPASMTKLMTFAVLSDKLQSGALTLDTPVHIDASDSHMGGTQVYLDPRETFPVEELIYAMMIHSANDAAHALARTAAGSVPAFVELMNAKARELGMTHTTFRTPHGLTSERQSITEGDITTPRDFSLLCRHVILKTDVLKYTSVRKREFGAPVRTKLMNLENSNKLIGKVIGVDGLKTGYTKHAGYCLSATAERNGRRVIAVIMGCFGPKGRETDFGRSRDVKMIELLERGFAALPVNATATAPIQPKPSATSTNPSVTKAAPDASPVATATPEVSPVQPAASPVAPAADGTDSTVPSVKFELPKKSPGTTK